MVISQLVIFQLLSERIIWQLPDVLFWFPYRLKGEQAINNDDNFSYDGAASSSSLERYTNSEDLVFSSLPNEPQETSSLTHLPFMVRVRQSTSPYQIRLLLLAMVVVVLVAFAGGYSVYHAVSQPHVRHLLPFRWLVVLLFSGPVLSKERMLHVVSFPCLKITAYSRVRLFTSLLPSLSHPVPNQPPTR